MEKKRRKPVNALLILFISPLYFIAKYAPLLIKSLLRSTTFAIVVGADSVLGVVSSDLSTVICWVVLFLIAYDIHKGVSNQLYGQFNGKKLVDLSVILCAFLIYFVFMAPPITFFKPFFAKLSSYYIASILALICSYVVLFSSVANKIIWRQSNLGKMEGPGAHFWSFAGRTESEDAVKQYRQVFRIPLKAVRKVYMFTWWVAPGLILAVISVFYGVMFSIFSMSTLILMILVVLWNMWKFRRSTPEEHFLDAFRISINLSFSKGLMGIISLVPAYLMLLLVAYPILSMALQRKIVLVSLVFLVPLIYLFYFWYVQTIRMPTFIRTWASAQEHDSKIQTFSLPLGGYVGFISICALFVVSSALWVYFKNSVTSLLFLFSLATLSLSVILLSLRKKRVWISTEKLLRDNAKIILSVAVQILCILLFAKIAGGDWADFLQGMIMIGLGIFVWYLPDWWRLLKKRYKEESVKRMLLHYGIIPIGLLPVLGLKLRAAIYLYVIPSAIFVFFLVIEIVRFKTSSRT